MSGALHKGKPIPPPAEITHPAEAEAGMRYQQAILDVMKRGRGELREQVKVLRKVVEYAVAGIDLIEEMQRNGALPKLGDNQHSLPEVRGARLGKDGMPTDQRVSEWRSLRDHDALGFIDDALSAGRHATFEKASVNWIRQRIERMAREAVADDANASEPAYDYELRHGDLRTALDDLAGQVDVIITDPPYPAEFLDEYDALGEVAARILKPDGMLVAMVGHAHLPEYMRRLSLHLEYRWIAAFCMEGPSARIYGGRSVATKWKPLLIYDRGGKREFLSVDVFSSERPEKDVSGEIRGWSQSESGMLDIVEHLSLPGDLVVDPFLGAGTTAVACHRLGRRFVGCDVSADAVLAARERMAAIR